MNNYKLVKNTEWKEVEVNGEVKEIPVGWEVQKIKNLLETDFSGEFGKEKGSTQYNVKLITLHVFAKTLKNLKSIIERGYEEKNLKKILKKGDILIEKSGGSTDFPVGRLFYFKEEGSYGCVNFIHCLRFDKINTKYAYKLLQKMYKSGWTKEISGQTTGISNLKIPSVLDSDLITPSESEQSSIASILSHQESIIQDIESLISKYESRFQYLSDELLSGRLRVKEVDGQTVLYKNPEDNWKEVEINGEIKEIPKDWGVEKINKIIVENNKSKIKAGDLKKLGLYPAFNCSKELSYFSNQSIIDNENLFLSTGGMAAIHYYNGEAAYSTDVYSITSNGTINNKFLFFMLKNGINTVNDMFYGAGLKHLNKKEFNNSDWFFPNNEEQNLIVYVINQQEKLINEQKSLLAKEKQKFNWLLDNLLSGKYLIKE